jgi:tetratricopeptide (TPR) repeat protein
LIPNSPGLLELERLKRSPLNTAHALVEVDIMLIRNVTKLELFSLFFALVFVVRVSGQGIPPGSATTDTGFGGSNTISGSILLSTGQRAEHRIGVRLQTMTRGDRLTTTDEYGNFVFRGLPSGDYTIVIDKEKDFEPFVQNVSIIQPRGMPPQTYIVSVRLNPKATTSMAPGVINAELAKIPKRAREMFERALDLVKKGDGPAAIDELKGAIAEYPDFMLAYNEMGIQYMKLNELQKADEALQSALKIDNKAFMPLMNRGIVLVMLKRYGEAEPLLREVVKQKKDLAVGHYFLGQAVANLGHFDEAEKELTTAIKLGGDEMKECHRLLAIIYSSQGKNKETIAELETYLQLAPTTPDAEQLRKVIQKLKSSDAPTNQPPKPSP